ncbi:hypothetical protein Tco_1187027, partial [Tanacetum coccineum]
ADKEEQHQMQENEKDLQDELEMMITQELAAKAMDDVSRQAFKEENRRIASQKKATQATSTNQLSTDRLSVSTDRPFVSTDKSFVSTDRSNTLNVTVASTSIGANVSESSFVYLGGKITIDASTLHNVDLPIDPNMHDLEDASDTLPNDGIFNGAYDDDEDMGAVADFNNMDNTIVVNPIPTLKIHKDHPKGHQTDLRECCAQIEGDEPEDQGRIIQDIDDDPLVSLVRESMKEKSTYFVTPTKASGEAQEEEISLTILETAKICQKLWYETDITQKDEK